MVDIILDITSNENISLDCLKYSRFFHPIIFCRHLLCHSICHLLFDKLALFIIFSLHQDDELGQSTNLKQSLSATINLEQNERCNFHNNNLEHGLDQSTTKSMFGKCL